MEQAGLDSGSSATYTTFGALLKYLRRRAGLTQRELGAAVGYSETQVTRLERDNRQPDPTTVEALFVDALGLRREPILARRLIDLARAAHVAHAASGARCGAAPGAASGVEPTPSR